MKAFHEKNIYPDGFPVDIVKFNHFNFLAHWHNDIEIVHVYEGHLRMTVNSETRILTAGESCICGSGDIHSYDSSDLLCSAILVFFSSEIIGSQIQWPQDATFVTPFIDDTMIKKYHIYPDFSKKIGELLLDVYHELEEKKEYYQAIVRSRLLELHGLSLRNVPQNHRNGSISKRYLMINKIQNALDFIDSNYMESITLAEAALKADLGISQFSKLFKHMCGMSFVTYLNHVRVSQAEEMLVTTKNSITDIAYMCGFSSIRNFNRTYMKLRKTKPSTLRKCTV